MNIPPAESHTQVVRYVLDGGFEGLNSILENPLRDKLLGMGPEGRIAQANSRNKQYGTLLGVTLLPPDVPNPREGQKSTNSGRASFQKGYILGLTYTVTFTGGRWLLSELEPKGIEKLNVPEGVIQPRQQNEDAGPTTTPTPHVVPDQP